MNELKSEIELINNSNEMNKIKNKLKIINLIIDNLIEENQRKKEKLKVLKMI